MNTFDYESLNNIVAKIELYKKEEILNVEAIESTLALIHDSMKMPLAKKLEDIEFELLNKLRLLIKNHENDDEVLTNTLTSYAESLRRSKAIIENINKG